jgi:hypothetical protein
MQYSGKLNVHTSWRVNIYAEGASVMAIYHQRDRFLLRRLAVLEIML